MKSFIDITLNDGVLFSNTYKFAKQGANGICIEPAPSSFRKLQLNHLLQSRLNVYKLLSLQNLGIYT